MTEAPEKPATVAIDGRAVPARFTTNGLCAVEATLGGRSLERVGDDMRAGRASMLAVRAIFRSLFVHELPDLSDVQAGRIMQSIGMDEVARVIQLAFDAWRAGQAPGEAVGAADAQGFVKFDVGRERYVLAFHFNAMAELEEIFPAMTMTAVAAELVEGGVSVARLRGLFRAALIDDRELSAWEAGELIDHIGMARVSDAVGKAFVCAFPKVVDPSDDADDEGGSGNRKARRAAAASSANPTKPRRPKAGTSKH